MSLLTRSIPALALAALCGASQLSAQNGPGQFRFYVGGQGGVFIFETPSQTQGGVPLGGAHFLITARRTGLIIAVDEGFGSTEVTSYSDPTASGGVRSVTFNDIRRYSATLVAYPLTSPAQPYFGVGFGIMHLHNPYPGGFFASPQEFDAARQEATRRGSIGFASLVGGLEFRVGGVRGFGQYQLTSRPGSDKLLSGVTHTLSGGLRFSLGSAREELASH